MKWSITCSINQIENWIKDLMIDNVGKLSHLKYMYDDLFPNKKRLWARLHDEVNGIIIFMTDLREEYFLNADIWLIDGTFRMAPKNFSKILNIMGAILINNTY